VAGLSAGFEGLLFGLVAGLSFWLGGQAGLASSAFGIAFRVLGDIPGGVAFWLGGGLAGVAGLAQQAALLYPASWSAPLATTPAASPIEVYRSDRWQNLRIGLVIGLEFGLSGGVAFGLAGKLALGVAFGLTFGLMFALTAGPALRLAVVEVSWALRGQRIRILPLLQAALDRQVLRQAGAVYQFRHAALQDLLAAQGSLSP
jgi:hypothetical protein